MNTSKPDFSIGRIPKTPAKGSESRAHCVVVQKEGNTNYYRSAVDEGHALEEEVRRFLDHVVGPGPENRDLLKRHLEGDQVRSPGAVQEPDRLPGAGFHAAEFLEDFPTVTRERAVAALEEAGEAVVAHARSA